MLIKFWVWLKGIFLKDKPKLKPTTWKMYDAKLILNKNWLERVQEKITNE